MGCLSLWLNKGRLMCSKCSSEGSRAPALTWYFALPLPHLVLFGSLWVSPLRITSEENGRVKALLTMETSPLKLESSKWCLSALGLVLYLFSCFLVGFVFSGFFLFLIHWMIEPRKWLRLLPWTLLLVFSPLDDGVRNDALKLLDHHPSSKAWKWSSWSHPHLGGKAGDVDLP